MLDDGWVVGDEVGGTDADEGGVVVLVETGVAVGVVAREPYFEHEEGGEVGEEGAGEVREAAVGDDGGDQEVGDEGEA